MNGMDTPQGKIGQEKLKKAEKAYNDLVAELEVLNGNSTGSITWAQQQKNAWQSDLDVNGGTSNWSDADVSLAYKRIGEYGDLVAFRSARADALEGLISDALIYMSQMQAALDNYVLAYDAAIMQGKSEVDARKMALGIYEEIEEQALAPEPELWYKNPFILGGIGLGSILLFFLFYKALSK